MPTLFLLLFVFFVVFSILAFIFCRWLTTRRSNLKLMFFLTFIFKKFYKAIFKNLEKSGSLKLSADPNNPIYYSVQSDYPHDTYVDAFTLLSSKDQTNKQTNAYNAKKYLMEELDFLKKTPASRLANSFRNENNYLMATNNLNVCNGTCSASSGGSDQCDASRNSTSTTTSGTNSTSSSKV